MDKIQIGSRYYVEITGITNTSKHYTVYYKPRLSRLFGFKEVGNFTINNFYNCKVIKVLNNLFIKEEFRNNGICNLIFEFLLNKFEKDDEILSLQFTTTNMAVIHCANKFGFTLYNTLPNPILENVIFCFSKNFTTKTV